MGSVINSIDKSLERVLKFYESMGTPLSYEPTFKYIDHISSSMPVAIAKILEEY